MLNEKLLGEEHSESSSNHRSDEEVGHGDYVNMAHQKTTKNTFSNRKLLLFSGIAVIAITAIVCGIMFSRQVTDPNTAVNPSSGSSNSASGNGVLDDTIPQDGSSSSTPGSTGVEHSPVSGDQLVSSKKQQNNAKSSSSSSSKMIRSDNTDYSGDYDTDYNTDYDCDYDGDDMNMPHSHAFFGQHDDDMNYGGSYDGDYDGDYDYMGSNSGNNDDWTQQAKQQHSHRGQHQQYRKVHECVVSQDGQDLIVRGIDRVSQCVLRSDTQEVGVKFDDEAIFPGAANDMNTIDIGVYMLYSETDGCSVLSERIICA